MKLHIYDYFYEMAKPRKKILEMVDFLEDNINEHLMKIMIFGETKDFNHWVSEIIANVRKINKQTLNGINRLPVKDYYKILFEEPFEPKAYDVIGVQIGFIVKQNTEYKPINEDKVYIYERLKKIDQRLAEMMASKVLTFDEIYSELEGLLEY